MHFYPRMIVDAATGWARSAKPAPGPSTEFPPDRRADLLYAIYPKFAVAPFHFDNPVTGRPPQYPEGVQAARSSDSAVPTNAPAIRNRAELEGRLAEARTPHRHCGSLRRRRESDRRVRLRPGRRRPERRWHQLRQPDPATRDRDRAGRQERKDSRTPAGVAGHIGRHGRMGRRRVRGHCRPAGRLMETSDARSPPHLVGVLSGRLGSIALTARGDSLASHRDGHARAGAEALHRGSVARSAEFGAILVTRRLPEWYIFNNSESPGTRVYGRITPPGERIMSDIAKQSIYGLLVAFAFVVGATGWVVAQQKEKDAAPMTIQKQGAWVIGGKVLGDPNSSSLSCDHGYVESRSR